MIARSAYCKYCIKKNSPPSHANTQRWVRQRTLDILKDLRTLERLIVRSPTRMVVYLVLLHYMRIITTFCFIASSVETAPQTKGACVFVCASVRGGVASLRGCFRSGERFAESFISKSSLSIWVGRFILLSLIFFCPPAGPLCATHTHTPLPGDLECVSLSPVLLSQAASWLRPNPCATKHGRKNKHMLNLFISHWSISYCYTLHRSYLRTGFFIILL